jgi:uncharacterized protein YkwD
MRAAGQSSISLRSLVRPAIVLLTALAVVAMAVPVTGAESVATASPFRVAYNATLAPDAWSGEGSPLYLRHGIRCWGYSGMERGFARAMNAERVDLNRLKLHLDPELTKAARVHSRDMAGRVELYHTNTSTLKRRITRWQILGENVGVGATVQSLHDAFMGSPAHRANVVYRSFNFVGVGVSRRDDRIWVTVIFENRADPGTVLSMPRCSRRR